MNDLDQQSGTMPACIGIIMDGNRRWAKAKGLPTLEGHTAGFAKAKEIVQHAFDRGVQTVVVYAFSTENWNRAVEEVGYLMDLFAKALERELAELARGGVRVHFIGDLSLLPEKLRSAVGKFEKECAQNARGKTLGVALSYGGRAEIVAATNTLLHAGKEEVNKEDVIAALWSADVPEFDLIVRTGGARRLSNFFPWQSAYSELFFSDTYWPDFTTSELDTILAEFAERERRHGT